MTPFVVSILKDQTVGQAIREIQAYVKKQPQFQLFYTAYVVDEYRHLIGTVSVTELLLADKRTLIQNLMNPEGWSIPRTRFPDPASPALQADA